MINGGLCQTRKSSMVSQLYNELLSYIQQSEEDSFKLKRLGYASLEFLLAVSAIYTYSLSIGNDTMKKLVSFILVINIVMMVLLVVNIGHNRDMIKELMDHKKIIMDQYKSGKTITKIDKFIEIQTRCENSIKSLYILNVIILAYSLLTFILIPIIL